MKLKFILGCIGLGALVSVAQVYTGFSKPAEGLKQIDVVAPSVKPMDSATVMSAKRAMKRAIASRGFLYEDFEDCTGEAPYALPDGWTTSGTGWMAGTITLDGSPLQGVSGMKYAFIFSNGKTDNDAWAFSPTVEMEAGKQYEIQLWTLGITATDIEESMDIMIGDAPAAANMTVLLAEAGDTDGHWRRNYLRFTPEKDGAYYIGFHSTTPVNKENSSGMIIDDLKVYTGEIPVFTAERMLDFGKVGDLEPSVETTMTISNYGDADMSVSLKECSAELSVEGLPAVIEAYEDYSFKVTLKPEGIGKFEGFLTLATNDPALPEVKITVTAEVEKSRITGYVLEDFESGGPEGWSFSTGCVNTADYGGFQNSTRCVSTNTYYIMLEGNDEGVGFTTHYVELGDDPTLSFWYKLIDADFFGDAGEPTPTSHEKALVKVYVAELGSEEWTKAFEISDEGDMPHVESADYAKATVDLGDFAGKTCKVKILFSQTDADDPMALMRGSIEVLVDNVEIGTPLPRDLGADFLIGKGAVTVGDDIEASLEITNYGMEEVEDYTVRLFSAADDELILSTTGAPIAVGEVLTLDLSWPAGKEGAAEAYAVVVTDNDSNPDNDRSNTIATDVLPADNQTAEYSKGKSLLSSAFPVNFGQVESFTQSIYPINDFGINKGVISSLVFISNMNSKFKSENFEVFVGETTKENFNDAEPIGLDLLTKVYEGSICFPEGSNEVVIPFSKPYAFSGGNLVVMCRKLGKEFVNNRNFVIHETPGLQSLQSYAKEPGVISDALNESRVFTNSVLPEIIFNFTAAEPSLLGGCVTSGNTPLKGVRLNIPGTGLYAYTGSDGKYEFPPLVADSYLVGASLHGYKNATSTDVEVKLDADNVCDIEMEPLQVHTLNGTITETGTGRPIAGAEVNLKGYDTYAVITNEDGKYSIDNVYQPEDGSAYGVLVKSPFFEQLASSVTVDKDLTSDFELQGAALRPNSVSASAEAYGVKVTWGDPSAELRYDTGEYSEGLGYATGWDQIIFGTAYHTDAEVTAVSWYMTGDNTIHSNVNVFVFGLDANGIPDPDNILYVARDVDYADNAWNVHTLSNPVKSKNGFMVALSCNGFMGIGVTTASEAYPFEEGMHYYAGHSYQMAISDMSEYRPLHLMLRATVGGMDECTKPSGTFDVYRLTENESGEVWTLIATTSEKEWTDKDAAGMEGRTVRYAVVAKSAVAEAAPVISNDLTISAVKGIHADGSLRLNITGNLLEVNSATAIAALELYDTTGLRIGSSSSNKMDVSSVASGIYILRISDPEGNSVTTRFIRK